MSKNKSRKYTHSKVKIWHLKQKLLPKVRSPSPRISERNIIYMKARPFF